MTSLQNLKRIHFIGIGGISMSGLAEIMLEHGYTVTGSDINDSPMLAKLRNHGATIVVPHDANTVSGTDLIVYTAAIKMSNVEMIRGKELNIPFMERAAFLGLLMKEYSYGIAISGCHGKTTTTSMVAQIFSHSPLDPTILVGGELDSIGGNVHVGHSEYFITEACEYVESFLQFYPFAAAILNIEEDHLDYFKDLAHIMSSFEKFIKLIPDHGYVFINNDDANTVTVSKVAKCKVITFGICNDSDYQAKTITYDKNGHPSFELFLHGASVGTISLSVPGYHNIQNALAAIAISHTAGLSIELIQENLLDFKGTHRRFDIKGVKNGITIVDDYAHHPTEIRAVLHAAQQFPHNKIWCIFQPHTYTRTKTLYREFCSCFDEADNIIITDIYAAREVDTLEIHAKNIVDGVNSRGDFHATYMKEFDAIVNELYAKATIGDIILTVGAGSITNLGPMILEKMN